jgi:hypothetical protein
MDKHSLLLPSAARQHTILDTQWFLQSPLRLAPSLSPWVLIGYIQFIMRSVLTLKRRARETCKTRHSLIFTGNNNKISRGEEKRGCNLPWRITTDKYFKGHWHPKFLLLISIRYTCGIFNFIFWPVCRV